jgi:hypothetical protein
MAQKQAMMRGVTTLRHAIIDYLQDALPGIMEQARDDWNLDENQLPYPQRFDAYEPERTDTYPHIAINVVQASGFGRVDYDEYGSSEYRTRYTVRLFLWTRTPLNAQGLAMEPTLDETIRCRDDITSCMRVALLRDECLGNPETIVWNEASLEESYSSVEGLTGNKFVAASSLSFNLLYDESVSLRSNNDVESIYRQIGLMS